MRPPKTNESGFVARSAEPTTSNAHERRNDSLLSSRRTALGWPNAKPSGCQPTMSLALARRSLTRQRAGQEISGGPVGDALPLCGSNVSCSTSGGARGARPS